MIRSLLIADWNWSHFVVHRTVIDRVDFLRPLGARAKDDLAARAVTRRYASGKWLWKAGAEPQGLFVILAGRVRIVRSRGRRQHVVHTEGPGATIGEIPMFSGGTYPASAVASEPVECLILDRAALMGAIRAHPELAFALLARLADRVRELLERLSARTADPVAARLAAYLASRPVRPDGTITLGGTQQHVAEDLGTVREVVVRWLRSLVESGVMERCTGGRYRIRDAERLRHQARSGFGD